jgi:hypothetical protein
MARFVSRIANNCIKATAVPRRRTIPILGFNIAAAVEVSQPRDITGPEKESREGARCWHPGSLIHVVAVGVDAVVAAICRAMRIELADGLEGLFL